MKGRHITCARPSKGLVQVGGWLLWWWNDLRYALAANKRCNRDGTILPPGHMGLPFFGEMPKFLWYFKFLCRPDDFVNSKRIKYGDNVGLHRTHLFGKPTILATSPLACKYIFQKETSFIREWPSVDLMGRYSLIAAQGVEHRRLKTLVVRSINQPAALRRVCHIVQPHVVRGLRLWANKGRINTCDEAHKVIFEMLGKFLVGFEPGPLLDDLGKQFEGMSHGFRAIPINLPGTAFSRALQCRKRATVIFRDELEKRKKKVADESGKYELMDRLMHEKDEEGKQLSDIEVVDNILNLVLGAHLPIVLNVMWAIYYLAKSPLVLQKLRDENIALSETKMNGEFITTDDIAKLTYTNKVVEETLRITNVAFLVFRTATEDIEYKGYKIPKGWQVVLLLRYLLMNPENFDDPMCFNPERWNEAPKTGLNVVFGGGSKMCAGNMLARLLLAIFIHHLAVGYEWKLVNPEAEWSYIPHPKPKDGVEILFTRLSN